MVACCSSSAEATVDKVVAGCLLLVAGAKAESMVNRFPSLEELGVGFFGSMFQVSCFAGANL